MCKHRMNEWGCDERVVIALFLVALFKILDQLEPREDAQRSTFSICRDLLVQADAHALHYEHRRAAKGECTETEQMVAFRCWRRSLVFRDCDTPDIGKMTLSSGNNTMRRLYVSNDWVSWATRTRSPDTPLSGAVGKCEPGNMKRIRYNCLLLYLSCYWIQCAGE